MKHPRPTFEDTRRSIELDRAAEYRRICAELQAGRITQEEAERQVLEAIRKAEERVRSMRGNRWRDAWD